MPRKPKTPRTLSFRHKDSINFVAYPGPATIRVEGNKPEHTLQTEMPTPQGWWQPGGGYEVRAQRWMMRLIVATEINPAEVSANSADEGMENVAQRITHRLSQDEQRRKDLEQTLDHSMRERARLERQIADGRRNKDETLNYSNVLLTTISEALEYDPKRHHNRPPPDLRINDDPEYLNALKDLAKELRRFNDILEKTPLGSSIAHKQAEAVNLHFNDFFRSFMPVMGRGTAGMLIGTMAGLLMNAGLPQAAFGGLWGLLSKSEGTKKEKE